MPRLLKPLEIADLNVLRTRLSRYEIGEIAHIENVMGKETRGRKHRRTHIVQTTRVSEGEYEQERQRDLESTERFELETEIQREIEQEEKFSVGLEVAGDFGPVKVSAYAKYDRSSSTTESERTAQKYAKELTEKAMERIKDRSLQRREELERTETEEINKHGFENDEAEHITGVYRWLDKYYLVKTINYGKRLFYEVVIPEPAAFFLFARAAGRQDERLPSKPQPPHITRVHPGTPLPRLEHVPLTPELLDETNYSDLAGQYGAEGVTPPPPETLLVSHSINKEFDPGADWLLDGEDVELPPNYEAVSCQFKLLIKTWRVHHDEGTVQPYPAGWPGYGRIQIGQNVINQWGYYELLGPPWGDATYSFELDRETNLLPISGTGDRVGTLTMNLAVECERSKQAMASWQLATYRAIMHGYDRQILEYEDQLSARQSAAGVQILGDNPDRNLLTIKQELKRAFLELWMGEDLDLPASITSGNPSSTPPVPPALHTEHVIANSETIAFAEGAFDWDNLSFRLLPYFHARDSKWIELESHTDPDPVFEHFLRAGAALLRVPVRPAYTHAVLYYQLTGDIWDRYAGPVPSLSEVSSDPEAELYNSFLHEIDPDEDDTDIHRVIEIDADDDDVFEIKVPTSLIWLQPDADLNPEPT